MPRFYTARRDEMHRILGKPPTEKKVWHGTGSTPPEKIYKDKQDGFMMQKSTLANMWGVGIYFADKASYSNSYAFREGTSRQMMLVTLLVGDAITLPSDRTLKCAKPGPHVWKLPACLGCTYLMRTISREFRDGNMCFKASLARVVPRSARQGGRQ